MPVREQNFIRETLHLIQSIRDEWRTAPLVLGGSSGSAGGSTGVPGGVVGKLSQRHVSGDLTEASTLDSSGSITSLVSNLDRIRYWELPSRQFGLEEVVPATDYWTVSSGSWHHTSGQYPLEFAGGNTPSVTPPVSGERIDLLTISNTGVLTWVQGDGSMPAIPSATSGSLPLWLIVAQSTGSACRNSDLGIYSHYILADMRPWLDWGVGGAGSSGSLTESYVGFGSASNTLTGSDNFTYSNGVLLVGGSSTPVTAAGSVVSVNNTTGAGTVSIAYGAGRTPVFAGYASHGALGSESASLLGDRLVALTGRGYGTTGFAGVSLGSIRLVAAEDWTDSAQGTQWEFLTTGSGADTPTKRMTLGEDGGLSLTQYLDLTAISNPPASSAGHARFHAATTQGFTRFEQDNEATTNLVLARDSVFIAKNTSGSSIAAGKPVYVTGSTGNVPNIALAKADSATTLPAIGMTLDAIGDNNFGQVMVVGVLSNINTSGSSTGAQLWVSPTTAGDVVSTRPVYPNLVQRVGSVLVSGVGNGSILVDIAPFIGGLESGTTSATWTMNGEIRGNTNLSVGGANDAGGGGTLNLYGGNGTAGNTVGGSIVLEPGSKHGSGTPGSVVFVDPTSFRVAVFNTSALTDNRIFSFPDVAGTFALGSGSSTVSSSNSVSVASHTHAVTSSSNPGAAASILATDSSGNMQIVNQTHSGDLISAKNATTYTGYIFIPLTTGLTSTSWDGDARSTTADTTIDLSAVFGVPAGVKAVLAYIAIRDSGSATTDCWIIFGSSGANQGAQLDCHTVNDRIVRSQRVVSCDANGDITFQCNASGSGTLDVWLEIWGYWI